MPGYNLPSGLLAFFITYTTYGTRLHGDERGTMSRRPDARVVEPDLWIMATESRLMRDAPFVMEAAHRRIVCDSVVEVCEYRKWERIALNVRTNHVHIVVAASVAPEDAMGAFKAWATRHLRESGLVDRHRQLWARHGSTRYLWTREAVEGAAEYVLHEQGADIPGSKPAG